MSNPQDHPGTPPPPSLSNSSSSTLPSVSPKLRFRRQKMLARKTIASGAMRKVLNERLKASQVKESPAPKSDSRSESESFQFATEGDRHGSYDFEKTQESPSEVKRSLKKKKKEGACGEERGKGKGAFLAICGVAQDRLDKSGMKLGGSGSGEAAEGLVHLSKKRDKPVSSTKETLVDLLKRVGASYNPKKRKATTPKAQNALEESKKRKKDKGKRKIAESSEAIEEEEMELVHQERGTTVEVPTPKPKKPKTSSKKSSSVPVAAEPTLAKRTRSAVKAKQTKVSDDGDWSGEEEDDDESEKEKDKLAILAEEKT
ncbi:protein pxr1-like [Nicotiana sylvestris]|uniref:protein pxr1-like n=1 Tax=Nicotiana sylvestris TaxID=4096 RepID=UPI00388CA03F